MVGGGQNGSEEFCAIEEDIEVPGAGDLDARYSVNVAQAGGKLGGEVAGVALLTGRGLNLFGKLEGKGKREIAEVGARRHFGSDVGE